MLENPRETHQFARRFRAALRPSTKPSPPLQRYHTLVRKSNPRYLLMFPAPALRSSLFTLSGARTAPFFSRPCVGTSFAGGRSSSVVRAMGSVPGDFSKPREVARKLLSQAQPEGDGATVRRSIGRPELKNLDPFLLLDYFESSGPAGFPDHPHRGFETVTYMLQGRFTHEDFAGHKGLLEAGDVQWMSAGRGIVHSEMPSPTGVQRGLQLWVNLAGKDKMIEPNYQELKAKDIPRVKKDGVEVVIIAGESFGVKSAVFTRTPTLYLDFYLQPGASVHQAIPEGWNAFTFIIKGNVVFGKEDSRPISESHTVVLSNGDGLSAWNKGTEPAQFVLVAGEPLNEPVVQYGPFVMNTKAQIMEAITDYQSGQNGFERAPGWRSEAKSKSRR